jgi:hypothetical protein
MFFSTILVDSEEEHGDGDVVNSLDHLQIWFRLMFKLILYLEQNGGWESNADEDDVGKELYVPNKLSQAKEYLI